MIANPIGRYEAGEQKPGIYKLIKIADYFNVSVNYIIGHTENPKLNRQKIATRLGGNFISLISP